VGSVIEVHMANDRYDSTQWEFGRLLVVVHMMWLI